MILKSLSIETFFIIDLFLYNCMKRQIIICVLEIF
jgi:hypothetical protein